MIIKFGDVFMHKEKEYIFLAKIDEILYTAEILNKEFSQNINRLYELKQKNPRNNCDIILYCFVILSTEEFKDRMVHFNKVARDEDSLAFNSIRQNILCEDDLKDIKQEITTSNHIPQELKDLVRKMDI